MAALAHARTGLKSALQSLNSVVVPAVNCRGVYRQVPGVCQRHRATLFVALGLYHGTLGLSIAALLARSGRPLGSGDRAGPARPQFHGFRPINLARPRVIRVAAWINQSRETGQGSDFTRISQRVDPFVVRFESWPRSRLVNMTWALRGGTAERSLA